MGADASGRNHPTDARWLTVDELAAYLRIGRTKAYEFVRSGRVPAVRFGSVWRIPLRELEETLTDEALQNRP